MLLGSFRELRQDRWGGLGGAGQASAVSSCGRCVSPPGLLWSPFSLGIEAGANSQQERPGTSLTLDSHINEVKGVRGLFYFPTPRGMCPLGSSQEQVTLGGPLRKRPGLWLWVGLKASAESAASGSHQARGGRGSCRGGLRRGASLLWATHRPTPLGAVVLGPSLLVACSLTLLASCCLCSEQ